MLEGGFEGITTAFMLLEIQSRNTLQVFCLWLHSQPCNQSALCAIFYLQQVFVLSAGEPTIRFHSAQVPASPHWKWSEGVQVPKSNTWITQCEYPLYVSLTCGVGFFVVIPGFTIDLCPGNALAGAWLRSTLQVVCSHPVLHSRSAAGQTQETRLVTLGTSAEECEQYTTGG